MNFDDRMKDAWHGETPRVTHEHLTTRIRRQRQRHRLQRSGEIALTLLAVLSFGRSLMSGNIEPAHWLLLPFFAVFLPVAWTLVLHAPHRRIEDVTENVSTYARLRLSQLRSSLRDLWLARAAAAGLVIYAVGANMGVWWVGDAGWRSAALTLLAYALAWGAATFWFSRRLRRSRLREYRSVRKLADG